jgi:exonuclease SbcD
MALPCVRVLLLADTHLGFDDPAAPRVARRRRGVDFFASYERVLDDARRERPDLVVHAGDVFAHPRIHRGIVDRAFEALASVAEAGVPVVVVPGNHDRSRLPPSLWLGTPGVEAIQQPRMFRFETPHATVAIGGFPFARRVRDRFTGLLAETGWRDAVADIRLLVMHQTIEGARAGAHRYRFPPGHDVIPRTALPSEATAVLSGHMHGHQVLRAEAAPPVVYPGSTERTSFGERCEAKGYCWLSFRPNGALWRLADVDFRVLPTRPMVDLQLDPAIGGAAVREHLRRRAATLQADAVVRLTSNGPLASETVRALDAASLREVFPDTMNVQLSVDLRRQRDAALAHS